MMHLRSYPYGIKNLAEDLFLDIIDHKVKWNSFLIGVKYGFNDGKSISKKANRKQLFNLALKIYYNINNEKLKGYSFCYGYIEGYISSFHTYLDIVDNKKINSKISDEKKSY